ncbi:SRR1 domain-containing protein [Caenorhabditis elegans]|uniref:SRR1 domain-containing protein n=1 Tax=Caenorhabditis elegans TaxID=6239 RepID=Q94290_CAEEL|nr:SRR1 domain-containing protein [Caenorhabditis elegans]CCD62917.2 SRR1 domain-containing protein [Caenorhabditis elegans]|eukprot:NP_508087.3 Uncharacterized protein CELE_M02E1.1 [Caenorhabditis elegans]
MAKNKTYDLSKLEEWLTDDSVAHEILNYHKSANAFKRLVKSGKKRAVTLDAFCEGGERIEVTADPKNLKLILLMWEVIKKVYFNLTTFQVEIDEALEKSCCLYLEIKIFQFKKVIESWKENGKLPPSSMDYGDWDCSKASAKVAEQMILIARTYAGMTEEVAVPDFVALENMLEHHKLRWEDHKQKKPIVMAGAGDAQTGCYLALRTLRKVTMFVKDEEMESGREMCNAISTILTTHFAKRTGELKINTMNSFYKEYSRDDICTEATFFFLPNISKLGMAMFAEVYACHIPFFSVVMSNRPVYWYMGHPRYRLLANSGRYRPFSFKRPVPNEIHLVEKQKRVSWMQSRNYYRYRTHKVDFKKLLKKQKEFPKARRFTRNFLYNWEKKNRYFKKTDLILAVTRGRKDQTDHHAKKVTLPEKKTDHIKMVVKQDVVQEEISVHPMFLDEMDIADDDEYDAIAGPEHLPGSSDFAADSSSNELATSTTPVSTSSEFSLPSSTAELKKEDSPGGCSGFQNEIQSSIKQNASSDDDSKTSKISTPRMHATSETNQLNSMDFTLNSDEKVDFALERPIAATPPEEEPPETMLAEEEEQNEWQQLLMGTKYKCATLGDVVRQSVIHPNYAGRPDKKSNRLVSNKREQRKRKPEKDVTEPASEEDPYMTAERKIDEAIATVAHQGRLRPAESYEKQPVAKKIELTVENATVNNFPIQTQILAVNDANAPTVERIAIQQIQSQAQQKTTSAPVPIDYLEHLLKMYPGLLSNALNTTVGTPPMLWNQPLVASRCSSLAQHDTVAMPPHQNLLNTPNKLPSPASAPTGALNISQILGSDYNGQALKNLERMVPPENSSVNWNLLKPVNIPQPTSLDRPYAGVSDGNTLRMATPLPSFNGRPPSVVRPRTAFDMNIPYGTDSNFIGAKQFKKNTLSVEMTNARQRANKKKEKMKEVAMAEQHRQMASTPVASNIPNIGIPKIDPLVLQQMILAQQQLLNRNMMVPQLRPNEVPMLNHQNITQQLLAQFNIRQNNMQFSTPAPFPSFSNNPMPACPSMIPSFPVFSPDQLHQFNAINFK